MYSQPVRHMLYQLHAWSVKKHERNMLSFTKKACNTCAGRRTLPSSCTVAHMLSFFLCNWFPATKKCSAASLPLMETALLRFGGPAADGNILCRKVGSVSPQHPFGVVSRSLRLLAVLSGDEPETNMWHRILVWRCHRSFGGHICGARLRAIDHGR